MHKLLLLLLPMLLFSKFQVTTTLPFQAHIIKKIGQNHIRIKTITNSTLEKAFTLSTSEIFSLTNTRAYFHFSLDFEKEYKETFLKAKKDFNIVDMSKNIKKLKYNGKDNPYIWLDPILLRQVAKNIYDTLSKIDFYNKKDYKKNYEQFLKDLDNSFLKTKKRLENSEIYNIFVFDEKFDYFAKRFKINRYLKKKRILSLWDVKPLINFVKTNQVRAIFIEERKNINFAKSLAGNTNIQIKSFNPYEEQLFYNLKNITKKFIN